MFASCCSPTPTSTHPPTHPPTVTDKCVVPTLLEESILEITAYIPKFTQLRQF